MNVERKTKNNFSSLSAKLFEEFEEKEKEPNKQKMGKEEQGKNTGKQKARKRKKI